MLWKHLPAAFEKDPRVKQNSQAVGQTAKQWAEKLCKVKGSCQYLLSHCFHTENQKYILFFRYFNIRYSQTHTLWQQDRHREWQQLRSPDIALVGKWLPTANLFHSSSSFPFLVRRTLRPQPIYYFFVCLSVFPWLLSLLHSSVPSADFLYFLYQLYQLVSVCCPVKLSDDLSKSLAYIISISVFLNEKPDYFRLFSSSCKSQNTVFFKYFEESNSIFFKFYFIFYFMSFLKTQISRKTWSWIGNVLK